MKKIIYCCLLIIAFNFNSNAQSYPIKETYDQVLENYYTTGPTITYVNNGGGNANNAWWEGWGEVLLSYLKTYQATGDKAYLVKFVNNAYNIVALLQNPSYASDGYWILSGVASTQALYVGQLLLPMAEYVYLVKNNNTPLYNTDFPLGSFTTYDSYTIAGFGDFANWLQANVETILDDFNNDFWVDDYYCYQKGVMTSGERNCLNSGCSIFTCTCCISDPCPGTQIEINWNASYGAAMYYLWKIDGIGSYLSKADAISNYFKSVITTYPQSYEWPHDVAHYYPEDVTHGAIDIQLPLAAYKIGSSEFNACDMEEFSHTFANCIYDKTVPEFHNRVSCDDDDLPTNFFGEGEILAWMPLYPYDDTQAPYDTYPVLLNQTIDLIKDDRHNALLAYNYTGTPHLLSGAQSFYGLSEVVKAQWSRDCPDLKLYNRDLTYSQDFNSKGHLTVGPQDYDLAPSVGVPYYIHTSGQASFADPVIYDDHFTIENSVTSNMNATASVDLKPGFEAKYGSIFNASVTPLCTMESPATDQCGDGNRKLSSGDTSQPKTQPQHIISDTESVGTLVLCPNPSHGRITVELNLSGTSGQSSPPHIEVFDIKGSKIYSALLTSSIMDIDLSNNAPGNYIYRVISVEGKMLFTGKFIIQ